MIRRGCLESNFLDIHLFLLINHLYLYKFYLYKVLQNNILRKPCLNDIIPLKGMINMNEVEENYKKLFWNLEDDYVYLDNAASTPVLKCVKEDTDNFLKTYGSIHRGAGLFSKISTDRYEEARHIIEKFVKAKEGKDVVIFTGNTTEAINKMAQIFPFKKGDYVLVSDIEHSSNLLPWQKIENVDKIKTNDYYEITK